MEKNYYHIIAATVVTCQELKLGFQVRLSLYLPIVEVLRQLRESGIEPGLFPKDTAWAVACWSEEVAQKAGTLDASKGEAWRWALWQLRMEDHPVAHAYEKGYQSIPRTQILGHALELCGKHMQHERDIPALEIARLLRVFSWQEEAVPKVYEGWLLNYMTKRIDKEPWTRIQTLEALLAQEGQGLLYPIQV